MVQYWCFDLSSFPSTLGQLSSQKTLKRFLLPPAAAHTGTTTAQKSHPKGVSLESKAQLRFLPHQPKPFLPGGAELYLF